MKSALRKKRDRGAIDSKRGLFGCAAGKNSGGEGSEHRNAEQRGENVVFSKPRSFRGSGGLMPSQGGTSSD